jgi:hypothetical protein
VNLLLFSCLVGLLTFLEENSTQTYIEAFIEALDRWSTPTQLHWIVTATTHVYPPLAESAQAALECCHSLMKKDILSTSV